MDADQEDIKEFEYYTEDKSSEQPEKVDTGKLTDMLNEFAQDLGNLHKQTEALKIKALLYNNKYIVHCFIDKNTNRN